MSLRSILLLAALGLWPVLGGCSQPLQPLGPPPSGPRLKSCVLPAEDYDVFAAAMEEFAKSSDHEWPDEPNLVVVATTTTTGGVTTTLGAQTKGPHPAEETIRNFNALGGYSCPLVPPTDSAVRYQLITQDELDRTFKQGVSGWTQFYARHPKSGGYWEFSPVAYDAKKEEALVRMDRYCGGTCGAGNVILLSKKSNHWIVVNIFGTWIS